MLKSLRDHFLRIDARSLGLFRLGFGLVLLGDLFRRWRWLKEFYTNEGVLPNHNHLFNLRDKEPVWSVLHAFSSPGEGHFAFVCILLIYAFFLVGYRTRVFQALSLVALVSLGSRNILLENAGNYAATALLAFTLFLPLGSRFSFDSLAASMDARDDKRAADLNDRPRPGQAVIDALRSPGWAPVSLAALAVLAQIAIVFLCSATGKSGPSWSDGTAFYYALNVERWVSGAGAALRSTSPALLALWTRLFRLSEWAIPALILAPFAFRWTRTAAAAIAVFHGLTLGVLFSFGLYGWTLVAAAALLVPVEAWERIEGSPREKRLRTVIYDADCGVCLWLCRVLKRLDLRGHLTFQGNDDLEALLQRGATGAVQRAPLPKEVTQELVLETVVVVDRQGKVSTRSAAVSQVVQALPLGWLVAWAMRLPGVSALLDVLYDAIATRRQRISVAMGKEACGITPPPAEGDAGHVGGYREGAGEGAGSAVGFVDVSPWTRLLRTLSAAPRELVVALMFAAMLGQTAKENVVPWRFPQGKVLAAIAVWPRMIGRWDVLAPAPPTDDEVFTIDGQTRGGQSLDLLTGQPPQIDPGAMRGIGLGQLWSDYLYRLHQKEWFDFQRAFRDYLARGGPYLEGKTGDEIMSGFDAYWLKQAIPAPGEARAPAAREKVFTHSRGGKLGLDKTLQLLRPDLNLKH